MGSVPAGAGGLLARVGVAPRTPASLALYPEPWTGCQDQSPELWCSGWAGTQPMNQSGAEPQASSSPKHWAPGGFTAIPHTLEEAPSGS